MSFSDIIAIVQTILIVVGLWFTAKELRKWRTELLGSKKVDAALRLGKTALSVKQAFKQARITTLLLPEAKFDDGTPFEVREQARKEQEQEEYRQRLQLIVDRLNELYDIRWEFSLLFGENDQIEDYVKSFNLLYSTYRFAVSSQFNGQYSKEHADVLFEGHDQSGDKFGQSIEENTNKLLEIARRYTL